MGYITLKHKQNFASLGMYLFIIANWEPFGLIGMKILMWKEYGENKFCEQYIAIQWETKYLEIALRGL